MKILAVDTTEWKISLALWEDGVELAFQEYLSPRDQAAQLPCSIQEMLGTDSVDLFLVGTGPGSFTGIRIGLGFLKGLSFGTGIPLKGMDKFTAIRTSLGAPPPLLILLEARRQDIYGQFFEKETPHPPQSFTRDDLASPLTSPTPPLIAGSGFEEFLSPLSYKTLESRWTGAQHLANAFFKDPASATTAAPFYVREADVTLPSPLNK